MSYLSAPLVRIQLQTPQFVSPRSSSALRKQIQDDLPYINKPTSCGRIYVEKLSSSARKKFPAFQGRTQWKIGAAAPQNRNLETTDLEDTMILNVLHILGVVLCLKSCIFLIFVTHNWISSSPVQSTQKGLLPYPAITSKMEICISWEDKQVSCFLPPANLILAHYGLHYCIKSPFRRIEISRYFSFINSHLQSKEQTSTG